eukprot:1146308-Pelagomonas_calceolata.AAC.5
MELVRKELAASQAERSASQAAQAALQAENAQLKEQVRGWMGTGARVDGVVNGVPSVVKREELRDEGHGIILRNLAIFWVNIHRLASHADPGRCSNVSLEPAAKLFL